MDSLELYIMQCAKICFQPKPKLPCLSVVPDFVASLQCIVHARLPTNFEHASNQQI